MFKAIDEGHSLDTQYTTLLAISTFACNIFMQFLTHNS